MECVDVANRLSAYLDEELAPEEALAVEEHLADCSSCRRRHDLLAATGNAVERLLAEPVSPGFEAAFAQRLAREQAKGRARRLYRRALALGAGLAAALAVAFVVAPARPRPAVAPSTTSPMSVPAPVPEALDCGLAGYVGRCQIDAPCANPATCGPAAAVDGAVDAGRGSIPRP